MNLPPIHLPQAEFDLPRPSMPLSIEDMTAKLPWQPPSTDLNTSRPQPEKDHSAIRVYQGVKLVSGILGGGLMSVKLFNSNPVIAFSAEIGASLLESLIANNLFKGDAPWKTPLLQWSNRLMGGPDKAFSQLTAEEKHRCLMPISIAGGMLTSLMTTGINFATSRQRYSPKALSKTLSHLAKQQGPLKKAYQKAVSSQKLKTWAQWALNRVEFNRVKVLKQRPWVLFVLAMGTGLASGLLEGLTSHVLTENSLLSQFKRRR